MSAAIDTLVRHPAAKPAAALINIALAAVLVYLLTRFLWLALDWNAPLPTAGDIAPAAPVSAPAPALARWHLFGNATLLVDPRTLADAPETTLPIDLRGVLAGDDPKSGRAFIVDASGEHSFHVGQEVAAGVLLDAVYPDRVALSRGGAIEVLKLRGGATAAGGTATAAAPPRSALPSATPAPAAAASNGALINPMGFGAVNPGAIPMVGVDMERVKEQLGVDPAVLANQITPMPVMENGKFVGVRLNGGQHTAVLTKLGLQPEDVVTAINGVPVTDPSRIGPAVAGLANASRIEVSVRRDGKMQNLVVDIPR